MKYEKIKELDSDRFRRLTGIKRTTFDKIINILAVANQKKKSRGGRKNKLSLEDQLLITLEYLREYRTYFHIGQSYGISESSAYKTVKWVEDTLIKNPNFALPGQKALSKNCEIILIDATETPIERPKKTASLLFRKKEKTHNKNSNYC